MEFHDFSMTFHDHSHFPWLSRPGKFLSLNSMIFRDAWETCINQCCNQDPQLKTSLYPVHKPFPVSKYISRQIRQTRAVRSRAHTEKYAQKNKETEYAKQITKNYYKLGKTGSPVSQREKPVYRQRKTTDDNIILTQTVMKLNTSGFSSRPFTKLSTDRC